MLNVYPFILNRAECPLWRKQHPHIISYCICTMYFFMPMKDRAFILGIQLISSGACAYSNGQYFCQILGAFPYSSSWDWDSLLQDPNYIENYCRTNSLGKRENILLLARNSSNFFFGQIMIDILKLCNGLEVFGSLKMYKLNVADICDRNSLRSNLVVPLSYLPNVKKLGRREDI